MCKGTQLVRARAGGGPRPPAPVSAPAPVPGSLRGFQVWRVRVGPFGSWPGSESLLPLWCDLSMGFASVSLSPLIWKMGPVLSSGLLRGFSEGTHVPRALCDPEYIMVLRL